MDKDHSTFKLAMRPGLYIGLISVALSLVLWATISDLQLRSKLGYIVLAIVAFMFYKFTVSYRETNMGGEITYGESFKFQTSMTVVYSLISAIYSYLLFAVLDPGMVENIREMAAEEMYKQNMAEEQIEAAIEMQAMFMTPEFMTISTVFVTFLTGVLLALIVSFFTKKEITTFD
ncbi:MAG: DUF4199 domain-containing protein [Bacteroidales bacterium]|nr:DUF4199 domain-containing protein [Bacteroidales bacterium]